MNSLISQNRPLTIRAFSIFEVLVVVVVIGILSGISISSLGSGTSERLRRIKLESDIKTINSAISSYRAFGGKLDAVVEPADIVAKLKSESTAESALVLPGLSGSFLDRRIVPVMQTASEASSNAARALWNSRKYRFEVADSGGIGVKEFRLDSTADLVVAEARKGTMDYARESGWIWDYQDRKASGSLVPSVAKTNDFPANSSGTAPEVPSWVPRTLQSLAAPLISIPGGRYPITDFDLAVDLSDPNPAGAGRIVYDGGSGWTDYTGGTIRVAPGHDLSARVVPNDTAKWKMSPVVSEAYAADPSQLAPPQIVPGSSGFTPGIDTISITLVNPNDPAHSELFYRIDGGSWILYTAPFGIFRSLDAQGNPVDQSDHRSVETYAQGRSEYYLNSSIASLSVPLQEKRLDPPAIAFDHNYFEKGVDTIRVTLDNPNPTGSSSIRFQIVPVPAPGGGIGPITEFMTYTGPFLINRAVYVDGFGINAFAETSAPGYIDSDIASRFATSQSGLFGGHLDLDTSTSIARIGNGSTSAHTHDITGKYDLTTIDMFAIPDSNQIEISEAITNPETRFKLTVINGNLSPGLTVSITYSVGGIVQRMERPVDQYGNIETGNLQTFTLGGAPGTAKLIGLKLQMSKDAIYDAAVIPSNTGDVRSNVLGKNGEWRNGALTVQAVQVNPDGSDSFTTDIALSNGGVQGAATSGMLWESTLFWHWGGDSYHEPTNRYVPGNFATIRDQVKAH